MARVCQYCGRGPASGNSVSHSNRHTRRRWLINLHNVRINVGEESFRVKVCARCLKSGFIRKA
ncbi:MAG: 50S ribosomal protein L28 [Synergistaceae bacterium]|nr:50S ribosomal protein L28 [Synergistaceae bacterium]